MKDWQGRARLLTVAAITGLLASTAGAASAGHAFPDVGDGHPFHEEIGWLADREVTGGYDDGEFKPGAVVSRQAAAVFLYRISERPQGDYQSDFADVDASHPFYTEISWAAEQGLVTGYEADNTFRPGEPATRQAWAVFLWRLANRPGVSGSSGFSDVPESHPFSDQITWLADNGIAGGYADGTFRPGAPVIRGAAAAFLYGYAEAAGALPNTSFEVTDGDEVRQVSASTDSSEGARTYTASGLEPGVAHTVVLMPPEEISVDAAGVVTFADDVENGGDGNGQADNVCDSANYDFAPDGALIEQVNGESVAVEKCVFGVAASQDGTLTLTVDSVDADAAQPVIWRETEGNELLDLDADDEPIEPFGVGGVTEWAD